MDLFIQGTLSLFSDSTSIMIFFLGLFGGMLFGAIPGVNMLTLGAVLLPFTITMDPKNAVMLFSVIYCAGVFGGAITAILFNIPGAPENAPTCLDGYPMTLKGEAGKAIGAAVSCSALGGTISTIVMMSATGIVASFAVRAFGPPEIFALILFGLAVSASIGASTLWKGWLSVLVGLMIATIGSDPVGGIPRFSQGSFLGLEYQSYYMSAGIHFIPMILGFFAVSEVLAQAVNIAKGTRSRPQASIEFPTIAEFIAVRWTIVRSIFVGFFSGILPGIGATLAAFLGYSQAERWSKNRDNFGKGELEGVVACETANNAATGAAMIPLLALGLPGGALTAMIMGIFQIHGMEPGPLIFINSGDLVWITFAAMFWANLLIIFLGWVQTKTVVHILRVPFRWLAPGILILAIVGAFALRNLFIDVWIMFIAGIAGYLLRSTGYSAAGVVLGLILGKLGEAAFAKSMQLMDYNLLGFLQRPISAVLIIVAAVIIITSIISEVRGGHLKRALID
ncbi:tripartite tricarboxylate transporter permease [Cognatishimia activa]|uniref:Tripartite tricarboxylate transporter TctA family protein n=1 Tax=Cognatishimia activa TaxID=1715691 RepID=A0A0P1IRD4_9RHOB|nr:tripartite tricarboxylate transporter permease [Cognatishimia activa]CUI27209.1 Tripartite tricarboxylate transporter TctA family protein [Cognatishimia activa]CUK24231.1 Tripartite tricarboxylate transporter TctA family protein [Cognatishimia activa]